MLIGNRSVLHKSPGRFLAGTIASSERSNYSKPGMLVSRLETFDRLSGGIPGGHLAPSSWALPRTAGGMSAINAATFALTPDALNLAEGRNIAGDTTLTFSVPGADLQLVVSASGTATLTFTQTGALAGALQAAGDATATFTIGAATLGALINATAAGTFSLTGSATARATGALAGDITPFTELSPEGLAAAVWNAVAADFNDAGTMGSKLNTASSGGVDLDALAAAVWAYTVRTLTDTVQPAQLLDVWQRLGLDPANPQTTTATTIEAGGVSQTIAEGTGTVTVTRLP